MSELHVERKLRRRSNVAESFIDSKAFLSDRFDVHDYANAVLQGKAYNPDAGIPRSGVTAKEGDPGPSRRQEEKGDLGLEVARLNYGIEDVTKQLRQEITTSYPLLLSHLTTSLALSSQLSPIRSSLNSLSSSIDRLHSKIHTPHEQLALLVRRLRLLALSSDLSRRAARFVLVARRLEGQMERLKATPAPTASSETDTPVSGEGEKEIELAKAALSVAELDALLAPPDEENEEDVEVGDEGGSTAPLPLQSLEFVQAYVPVVDKARDTIITEMESMVRAGLANLNQPLISSSLQTAHNLRLLPDLVSNLVADLNDTVTLRVQRTLDSAAIGREVSGKETSQTIRFTTRSRQHMEPSSSNVGAWTAVLWNRLDRLIEDVAACCIKVYTLEKVLRIKRDAVTNAEFLDEVMQKLDEKPSFTFWTTLATAFESQCKDAARANGWLQQALSNGYPRLLRLFHDFFAKIAVHTDTIYTRETQSPEAVLALRSVSIFESLYLSRSTSRMSDAVSSAMSHYSVPRGTAPSATEGVNIARAVTNELDSARFDPLLVRTVARNAVKVLKTLKTRIDGALVRDFTATSLIGPTATPAAILNAQLISCLYHCTLNLSSLESQFGSKVAEILIPSVQALEETYRRVTDLLDIAIKREFSTILARIHRVDFSKPVDPMAMNNSSSPYMQELLDKLNFLRLEVLGRSSLGEFMRKWVLSLSKYLIKTFLLHASIARPMGESGRLKLTGNMTEFEMGLQNFLNTGGVQGARGGVRVADIGEEYLALRTFRTLLFADRAGLTNPVETVHLPPLIVLHHIIVRSPLRLPHEVHGWSEAEYVLWVQKHEDEHEQWDLLQKAVDDQVAVATTPGVGHDDEDRETVELVREVLEHARHHHERDRDHASHNHKRSTSRS
ncbi:hypothetical protein CspeluHIS016_0602550 [Cutaneotrichosporon spelunceum]|uniref:Conserved oligomeric Golgi complex subunit 5 n=1 Tax=Cutaneotrichosporon spelunceum TaxID=1672016 RepID=A0AAD3TXN9_9TREE|nr:hypothetical protein CspeluHIS016_0602550 [Cutaneotrichosporon spelunceum]